MTRDVFNGSGGTPGSIRTSGRLRLHWRELSRSRQPPARRGFGSRLIDFAATRELAGMAELTFAPNGLTATIEIPLSQN